MGQKKRNERVQVSERMQVLQLLKDAKPGDTIRVTLCRDCGANVIRALKTMLRHKGFEADKATESLLTALAALLADSGNVLATSLQLAFVIGPKFDLGKFMTEVDEDPYVTRIEFVPAA